MLMRERRIFTPEKAIVGRVKHQGRIKLYFGAKLSCLRSKAVIKSV